MRSVFKKTFLSQLICGATGVISLNKKIIIWGGEGDRKVYFSDVSQAMPASTSGK
jgi:hypothetical protein